MIARSHDGTVAPSHIIARHTYAETFDRLRAEQASLEAKADAALAHVSAVLRPAPDEHFWIAALYPYGWRTIYYNPSPLTRMLAVRLAAVLADASVGDTVVLRGDYSQVSQAKRQFCDAHGLVSISLVQ